jgi:O-antigen chain-terminating methyltransferase
MGACEGIMLGYFGASSLALILPAPSRVATKPFKYRRGRCALDSGQFWSCRSAVFGKTVHLYLGCNMPDKPMPVNPPSEYHVDEFMRKIDQEVAQEKRKQVGEQQSTRGNAGLPSPPVPSEYHVQEFLGYDGEKFLQHAYSIILGRELDAAGRRLFLEKLLSKKLSKIELLARLRYSGEGRRKAVPIRGNLAIRALARSSFRIPVIGYLLALANYLAKLPALNESIESLQSGMRQERESNADALHAAQAEMWKRFWDVIETKVDKEPFWELSDKKLDRAEVESTIGHKVEKDEFWDVVNLKVDKEFIQPALAEIESRHRKLSETLSVIESRQREQKIGLLDQQRRMALLLEEARKRMPEPFSGEQVAAMAAAADHWLDAHYLSFEDVFRGSRQDIKQRVEVYLPVLRGADAGVQERPVIDLGCGRGELLELLKDNGLVARGVDLNQILIEQCRGSGLDVTEADAIAYLEGLPAASVGAITGLHIIEHIPFERLVRLLDESLRVLKPGGVVAFETPNPENLLVGACNFYYDPTHLNPLPPPVTQFLIEARGFVRVEIQRLTENRAVETLPEAPEGPGSEPLNQVISFINRHFAAPPDYAVIGYKA